eukprot:TRINITY_DN6327_c0_g1_i1.p1 TRINITY_DN6327_c0_g1~~TRINITY_DN6327_c0_g1_i1.p1  ORF type:complete len:106 (-),score=4.89 TRINITY_DN6327_c0_g1_i1:26-343(-)
MSIKLKFLPAILEVFLECVAKLLGTPHKSFALLLHSLRKKAIKGRFITQCRGSTTPHSHVKQYTATFTGFTARVHTHGIHSSRSNTFFNKSGISALSHGYRHRNR